MQRRAFLKLASGAFRKADVPPNAPSIQLPTGTLEQWIPSAENPWDELAVLHFFNRLGFGPTREEVRSALVRGLQDVLREAIEDEWLDSRMPGPMPGWDEWLYTQPYNGDVKEECQKQEQTYQSGKFYIKIHWTSLMSEPGSYLREKLTLFWHNHFVVDVKRNYYPRHSYDYMQTLRRHAWGNFKQMVKDISILPAMLIYLDNVWSEKDHINENYAREMLELFVVGRTDREGRSNYTQEDVVNVAQALAGWRYWIEAPGPDIVPTYFAEYYFDFATKRSPLGASPKVYGLLAAREKGIYKYLDSGIEDDIIDSIFTQRADEISWHIAEKLYRFFVANDTSSDLSQQVIGELAQDLKSGGWELKPVLVKLFSSAHFFDPTFRGALVKSPLEFVIGTMRHLDMPVGWNEAGCLSSSIDVMNQILMSPPNVKGWPGYHDWLDSSTLSKRNVRFSSTLASGNRIEAGFLDPHNGLVFPSIVWSDELVVDWAGQFDSYTTTIVEFAQSLVRAFVVFPFSEEDIQHLLSRTGIVQPIAWSTLSDQQKVPVVRSLVQAILNLPHTQLS